MCKNKKIPYNKYPQGSFQGMDQWDVDFFLRFKRNRCHCITYCIVAENVSAPNYHLRSSHLTATGSHKAKFVMVLNQGRLKSGRQGGFCAILKIYQKNFCVDSLLSPINTAADNRVDYHRFAVMNKLGVDAYIFIDPVYFHAMCLLGRLWIYILC